MQRSSSHLITSFYLYNHIVTKTISCQYINNPISTIRITKRKLLFNKSQAILNKTKVSSQIILYSILKSIHASLAEK